jgi:uncharacterized protein YcfJ
MKKAALLAAAASVALASCASPPLGPTVSVMPAPNKPFPVFQQEDAECRGYAGSQVAGAPEQANSNLIGSTIVGTLLGAAIGGAAGGGKGAAIGAGAGAVIGTGVGANGTAWSQMSIQQRYNVAYIQCMYSHGNQVPGYTVMAPPPPPPPPPR